MATARFSRRPAPRSRAEWALRGGLAAAALALGIVSTMQTFALTLVKTNPVRANALALGDGSVAGQLAQEIAARDVPSAERTRATHIARRALAEEPLAVSALTALGLNAQMAGNTMRTRRLFVHSDALSRRELGTRLWLIEDAVERGDVPGALRHYDIALRTGKTAPSLLFPILASAIEDQAVSAELLKTLARNPAWRESFIAYLGGAHATPVINARFLRRLSEAGVRVSEAAQVGAINNLIVSGAFADGWSYYASVRKGADRRRSRDPEFTAQLPFTSILDWTPVMGEPGVSASIDGGMFDFAAPSTVGGVVLQQMQVLPPGRYRLEGSSAGVDQPVGSRPYWQLVCVDGRELGRVDLPNSAENTGRFAGIFTVGDSCPVQTLRLIVRSSTAIGGSTGQIERALLKPVGQAR